jgi:hypothetical protein
MIGRRDSIRTMLSDLLSIREQLISKFMKINTTDEIIFVISRDRLPCCPVHFDVILNIYINNNKRKQKNNQLAQMFGPL